MSLLNKKTMYLQDYNEDGKYRRSIPQWVKLVI